jgi:hypothetical protein
MSGPLASVITWLIATTQMVTSTKPSSAAKLRLLRMIVIVRTVPKATSVTRKAKISEAAHSTSPVGGTMPILNKETSISS